MTKSKEREKSPVKEIMCLSNLIKRNLDSARSERDDTVTPMHGFIIGYVAKNHDRDVFQKDIEKAFSYRRSTASTVLGLMEEKGLIERVSVPYDARLKKIVLTDEAKRFAESCYEDGRSLDEKILAGLTSDEAEKLFSVLEKIRNELKGGGRDK